MGDDNGFAGTLNESGGTLNVNNRVRLAHWPNKSAPTTCRAER